MRASDTKLKIALVPLAISILDNYSRTFGFLIFSKIKMNVLILKRPWISNTTANDVSGIQRYYLIDVTSPSAKIG